MTPQPSEGTSPFSDVQDASAAVTIMEKKMIFLFMDVFLKNSGPNEPVFYSQI
jgi:hypothetical protein